ncbi:MAG: leucine-rich repeat protein [Muribaculaceae bacterium]|nr:leucine-rich repeat protein [Muribaculaceae bacterium]
MKKNYKFILLAILAIVYNVHTYAQVVGFNAKVTEYGQLKTVLGDNWNKIDSLSVTGPINATDFKTLWECAFYGSLNVINLENAQVENYKIPDWAFYDSDKQFWEPDYGIIHLNIRKIILPDNIEEIGYSAFSRLNIEEINLPASLRKLDMYSFAYCYKLKTDVIIPDGVTDIPVACFLSCQSFKKLVLPSSVRFIEDFAFENTRIEEIEFSEGLEKIGMSTFAGSYFTKLILPNSCKEIGTFAFSSSYFLKEIRLPEGLKKIPENLVSSSVELENVYIPESVEEIGNYAFQSCNNLKNIFSLSPTPPYCAYNSVFSGTNSDKVTVYVPVGSAELYRNAQGWNNFTNFIETENFPSSSIKELSYTAKSKVYYSGNSLIIDTNNTAQKEYWVFSFDGKLISQGITISSHTELHIPKGLYIVKVGNDVHKIR